MEANKMSKYENYKLQNGVNSGKAREVSILHKLWRSQNVWSRVLVSGELEEYLKSVFQYRRQCATQKQKEKILAPYKIYMTN